MMRIPFCLSGHRDHVPLIKGRRTSANRGLEFSLLAGMNSWDHHKPRSLGQSADLTFEEFLNRCESRHLSIIADPAGPVCTRAVFCSSASSLADRLAGLNLAAQNAKDP